MQAERQGWHAALRWEQRGQHYHITLSSPLGQDIAQLDGGPGGVQWRSADAADTAQDGETLLYRRLGLRLPVSGLRFWVLGLPDPGVPVAQQDRQLDGLGRLTRLRQSGWDIEFRRYAVVDGMDLPDKLFLTTQTDGTAIEVRVVVEQWRINQ